MTSLQSYGNGREAGRQDQEVQVRTGRGSVSASRSRPADVSQALTQEFLVANINVLPAPALIDSRRLMQQQRTREREKKMQLKKLEEHASSYAAQHEHVVQMAEKNMVNLEKEVHGLEADAAKHGRRAKHPNDCSCVRNNRGFSGGRVQQVDGDVPSSADYKGRTTEFAAPRTGQARLAGRSPDGCEQS
eukprot:ANDGO_02707.mRNA.1 hypothetical protein